MASANWQRRERQLIRTKSSENSQTETNLKAAHECWRRKNDTLKFTKETRQCVLLFHCAFADWCTATGLSYVAFCLALRSPHSHGQIRARLQSRDVEKFHSGVLASCSIFVNSPSSRMSNATTMCVLMCVASCVCECNSNKTVWSCICSWCVLFNHVCTSQSTIMFGLPYLSSKSVSASMCTSRVYSKAYRPICNTIVVVTIFLSNIQTCFHAEMWHYRIQELDLW